MSPSQSTITIFLFAFVASLFLYPSIIVFACFRAGLIYVPNPSLLHPIVMPSTLVTKSE